MKTPKNTSYHESSQLNIFHVKYPTLIQFSHQFASKLIQPRSKSTLLILGLNCLSHPSTFTIITLYSYIIFLIVPTFKQRHYKILSVFSGVLFSLSLSRLVLCCKAKTHVIPLLWRLLEKTLKKLKLKRKKSTGKVVHYIKINHNQSHFLLNVIFVFVLARTLKRGK